jgi:catechol 2,3-dioxygenase-like lactoylglutathione lyase family enzyme
VFDHVTIRASDRDGSRRFYETVLGSLGRTGSFSADYDEWEDFSLAQASPRRPVTRHLHTAFVARDRNEVDAFWRAGVEAGFESDGEPGFRPQYGGSYYGAFLLDPDRNSAEAVHHGRAREGDNIVDHLWIRVADLNAARGFYEAIAPVLGLEIGEEQPEHFHVRAHDRSFAIVLGPPVTENLHIAFPAPDDATVERFHRAALAAGARDNGLPGERSYHPGYYGAFVLDPDGNNVEAVNHNR